jgi:hypothetical protein
MRCKFCGFTNGEDDHRCLRCQRRIGTAISAPPGFSGANALAVAPTFDANETQDFLPMPDAAPAQGTLFRSAGSNVIPFDQLQRHVTGKLQNLAPPPARPGKPPAGAKPDPTPAHHQFGIDFNGLPVQPVTKTNVLAQVYCDRPVATPTHRFVAGAMDAAMVMLGFGMFVVICEATGSSFGGGRLFWITMALAFGLVALTYGLVFAVMGHETAGMYWTDLQLITFDGAPVEGKSRAVRVASAWLSFCSGGLGLIWALADEETLTWHDHISRTFPTIRETSGSFVRPGRA